MNGQFDKEEAVGTVYDASLPFLKADESVRVEGATLCYIPRYEGRLSANQEP